jgi:hypothetical protein
MTIAFYEQPFSSYVQKAKTALYEKGAGGTPDQGRARSADVHAY